MPVVARSDEPGNRLRPFPGARPPRRGQWTVTAHRSPTRFLTAVKGSNDRMRGSLFSSCKLSLPHRREGRAPLRAALAECVQVLSGHNGGPGFAGWPDPETQPGNVTVNYFKRINILTVLAILPFLTGQSL